MVYNKLMSIDLQTPSKVIDIKMLSSPEYLSLSEAKKIAGIAEQTHVEILGTYPDVAADQRGNGFVRLTSLNQSAKWSNDAYQWCVGSAGFAINGQSSSFLVHAVTHGDISNAEDTLQQQYRCHIRRMLDSSGNADCSDIVIFGGTNPSEHQKNCSREVSRMMGEIVSEESRGMMKPLIISLLQEDTMKEPIPKRVLLDTEHGRLFYFEAGSPGKLRNRSHRM